MFVDFTGLKEVGKFIKHLLLTTNINLMLGCQVRPYPKLRAKGSKQWISLTLRELNGFSKKCFTFLKGLKPIFHIFWLLWVGNTNLCARSISNNVLTYNDIQFFKSVCIAIKQDPLNVCPILIKDPYTT